MQDITQDEIRQSMAQACHWLVNIAQTKNARLTDEPGKVKSRFNYKDYRGSIKGEYVPATQTWDDFCPIWHTGQAVAALVKASEILQDSQWLDAAKFSAEFILRHQITDSQDEDYGLILAFEGEPDFLNTSAIMESLLGLIELHRVTSQARYIEAAHLALKWIIRKVYMPNERMIADLYLLSEKRIAEKPFFHGKGRPLIDDFVFYRVGKLCRDEELQNVQLEVMARLMEDGDVPDCWISYEPCDPKSGVLHPRQAYWWGLPFLYGYEETGDKRLLDIAKQNARWYIKAMRSDGGIIRETHVDFKTSTFNQATSGTACAVILLAELWRVTQEEEWLAPLVTGLDYCMGMQITEAKDPNLQGVIVEKYLYPYGTDQLPIYIRDLGTIFFIQAAATVLACKPEIPIARVCQDISRGSCRNKPAWLTWGKP